MEENLRWLDPSDDEHWEKLTDNALLDRMNDDNADPSWAMLELLARSRGSVLCKACFELLPKARVGLHAARTSLPPPPPRLSGAPARWLTARGRRAHFADCLPRLVPRGFSMGLDLGPGAVAPSPRLSLIHI